MHKFLSVESSGEAVSNYCSVILLPTGLKSPAQWQRRDEQIANLMQRFSQYLWKLKFLVQHSRE
jgi:hypothetical protein